MFCMYYAIDGSPERSQSLVTVKVSTSIMEDIFDILWMDKISLAIILSTHNLPLSLSYQIYTIFQKGWDACCQR